MAGKNSDFYHYMYSSEMLILSEILKLNTAKHISTFKHYIM